ncbi:hypothetical protein AXF42_Ash012118 [Apostasia shenzhenica]|uniref:DUF7787 domain-containing protein n=1 Tax=Apostasia shenzhenica TaxID=1088818 RepID=A0A2I0AK41_9ASPA|nr:hypothetical protein AXF42_Ash012118 [Apostasia shenzhenica]
MKGEKQKLWLEQYVEFFNYKSSEFLTKDQLIEIASINGFAKSRSRKLHIAELLGSIELTPPGRSTVGKCPVRSSSTEGISLAEAVKDIASIGWQECSIGSVLAVGGSAAATIEVEVVEVVEEVEEAAPFSFPSGSKDSKKTKSKRKRKTASAIFSQPLIGTAE